MHNYSTILLLALRLNTVPPAGEYPLIPHHSPVSRGHGIASA